MAERVGRARPSERPVRGAQAPRAQHLDPQAAARLGHRRRVRQERRQDLDADVEERDRAAAGARALLEEPQVAFEAAVPVEVPAQQRRPPQEVGGRPPVVVEHLEQQPVALLVDWDLVLLVPYRVQCLADVLRLHLQVGVVHHLARAEGVGRPRPAQAPVRRAQALGADDLDLQPAAHLGDQRRVGQQRRQDLDFHVQLRRIALEEAQVALETRLIVKLIRREDDAAEEVGSRALVVIVNFERQVLPCLVDRELVLLAPHRVQGLADVLGPDRHGRLALEALDLADAEGVGLAAAEAPVRGAEARRAHDGDLQAAPVHGDRRRRLEPQHAHLHRQGRLVTFAAFFQLQHALEPVCPIELVTWQDHCPEEVCSGALVVVHDGKL
mmetsp:Transcript_13682/g.40671  ORF Transcript_13682/g.40671 Transcript_13682/m.40671 type:complete len:383 (-) Transcript_13682:366-1514(-)